MYPVYNPTVLHSSQMMFSSGRMDTKFIKSKYFLKKKKIYLVVDLIKG